MKFVTLCFLSVLGLLLALIVQETVGEGEGGEGGDGGDEEWPYDIILTSCKSHMDASFGRSKCSLKKPKGEKYKRLTLFIETVQEIFCEIQVTMSAKIKSNGNWVDNYNSEPKDYANYYRQNEGLLKQIYSFGNFTECPMPAGRYEINNLLIDETNFPKELDCGEYIMVLTMQMPGTTALRLEVGAAVEKK